MATKLEELGEEFRKENIVKNHYRNDPGKEYGANSADAIGNGDVSSLKDYINIKEHTNCDGVMIGRAALGNPWIFNEIYCPNVIMIVNIIKSKEINNFSYRIEFF